MSIWPGTGHNRACYTIKALSNASSLHDKSRMFGISPSLIAASQIENNARWPIINTPVNFNLINSEQSPRLDRSALISLVKWMENRRKKDEHIEAHGMGTNSTGETSSISRFIRSDGSEENKNKSNEGGNI